MNPEKFFNQCKIDYVCDMQRWHILRGKGLGGSDAAIVLGISPYKTKYELWEEKTGRRIDTFKGDEATDKGNRLEPVLFNLFKELYPRYQVIDTKDISLSNRKCPFFRANLDGALLDENNRKGILELKTTTIQNARMLDQWKDNSIPQNYYCQVLHYLACTGFEFAVVYCLADIPWGDYGNGTQQTFVRIINRSEVLDDINFLVNQEIEFWNKHIVCDIPPKFIEMKM